MPQWKTPELKNLAQTLLLLKKEADLLDFLRDLLTLEELKEFSRRWQAAKMLYQGSPYRTVAKKTGLSTTTVSRIALWLWHGERGYLTALKKLPKKP